MCHLATRIRFCLLCILAASSPAVFAAQPSPSADAVPVWAGQIAGEPFDVKAFLASRAEPANNAAPLCLEAIEKLTAVMESEPAKSLASNYPEAGHVEASGSGGLSWEQVKQVVESAQPATDLLDQAQAIPDCIFPNGLDFQAFLPEAQSAKNLSNYSMLSIYYANRTGGFAAAEAAIKRSLRLSRDLQRRGGTTKQMIAMAIDLTIGRAVTRSVLVDRRLTTPQIDSLLSIFMDHEQRSAHRVEEGLKVDYIIFRNTIADLQTGQMTAERLFGIMTAASKKPPLNISQIPPLNFQRETEAANRLFGLALGESNVPALKSPGALQNELSQMVAAARTHEPVAIRAGKSDLAILIPTLSQRIKEFQNAGLSTAAVRALLQIGIAVKRFEVYHNGWPSSLEVAAAETPLKTVPADPFSGEPLKYSVVNGRPTIYSVGQDLKDDGGNTDLQPGSPTRDILFVLTPRPQASPTPPLSANLKTSAPPPTANSKAPATPVTLKPKPLPQMPLRTWTSTTGTKIEARLLAVEDEVATLQRKSGPEIKVPLDKLSPQDQQWIISNIPQ